MRTTTGANRFFSKALRNLAIAGLVTAGAVASLNIAAQAQEQLTLKIGSEGAYPPYNFVKADGSVAGFEIDIANALCEELKAKCEIIVQDWDGMIPALQSGKLDAVISSMSITPARKEQVDFSNKYYNPAAAIAVPKDSDVKGTTKEDLAGKTIGVQSSTIHAVFSEHEYTDSTITPYGSVDEARMDMVSGRVDAVNDNIVSLIDWLKTPEGECCKLVGPVKPNLEIHGPGVGVAIKKGREELVEKFNTAILAIRDNGKYKEINDKYFDFDIYGE
ncbi:transporter substrate-binding domain-containing protein [Pseudochrobactrum asaccharolyticum]|jgi:lysine-arginine-ornithine-binding protein|uniref:L-arginine-binding protein /L-ornithine-binding protein n=1 Tax=Pseudochrobactrum asaccharolyticum TaxID=354351 RepID=A0A366E9T3_9HYPH|nr:transporter substrate-binding domain-containing protein [Pseudochrobactrum asaccharolyticum]MBX8801340.1 transporter substrate-binding domain-containing protein [Ochrobactrum sp. MR28]MBX8817350.1 transporter substrate-binding domain-containing protein [Ochrobactrum sp. MR31]RBO99082.1 L-arginine-binding protein /L-ornithine-binding protein [Pseudochrobactrum asaccharolyticum]